MRHGWLTLCKKFCSSLLSNSFILSLVIIVWSVTFLLWIVNSCVSTCITNFICSMLHIFNNILNVKNIRAFLDLCPTFCCLPFFMSTFILCFTFLSFILLFVLFPCLVYTSHNSHAIFCLGFSFSQSSFFNLLHFYSQLIALKNELHYQGYCSWFCVHLVSYKYQNSLPWESICST